MIIAERVQEDDKDPAIKTPLRRLTAVNLLLQEWGCSAVGRDADACYFFRWRTLNVAVQATMLWYVARADHLLERFRPGVAEGEMTNGTPTMPAATLSALPFDRLEKRVRGEIIRPGDGGYERARRVWNASIDRYPAVIVRCTGAADVIGALDFARGTDLPVAVRGGGHNVAGNAVCDDGLVIDLSGMKGIQVDPDRRIAQAQPGLTWAEFDHETQAFGLATPGGLISSTGIAGFTLGGAWGG